MWVVAANAVMLWKIIQDLSVAVSHEVEVGPLFYEGMQEKASRLEDSIDIAISLGLYEDLLSSRSCTVNQYALFFKFLAHLQTLYPHLSSPTGWGSDEFVLA